MPIRIEHVRRSSAAPAPTRFAHFHKAHEIVIFEEVSGVLVTDDARFDLAPGCGVHIPSTGVHDFELGGGRSKWTLIHYYPNFAQSETLANPICVNIGAPERKQLPTLCYWLADAVSARRVQEARCYLDLILLILERAKPLLSDGVSRAHALSRFRPFLSRMRDEPSATLSLSEAASLCHLSTAYFSRLFRVVFGCGFADYMLQTRLENAALLLASTSAPVFDISYKAGFGSHAYFAAQFRRRFGTTPTEFRRRSLGRRPVAARPDAD